MGDAVHFSYRLPLSCIRVKGSRTSVHDMVLDAETTSAAATVGLDVMGDHHVREGEIDSDLFTETKTALEWSDDGRLVTSSVDVTGQGGKIIAGIVGAGAALAGVLTANPGLALAGSAAGAIGMRFFAPQEAAHEPEPSESEKKVADAYASEHPDVAQTREMYAELVADLLDRLGAALKNDDDTVRARRLVHALEYDLASARSQLSKLDELFKAWRATKIESRVETYEFTLSLDDIEKAGPTVDSAGTLQWTGQADDRSRKAVQEVLEKLDLLVTVEAAPGTTDDAASKSMPEPPPSEQGIVIRWPRRVQLTTYEKKADGFVPRSSTPALIMDASCHHEVARVSQSLLRWLFSKQKIQMGFSASGGLHSITVGSTSAAAGLADTLGALPGGVASSLGYSKKIVDRVYGLRETAVNQEIDRLTNQIKLKQLELDQAGLAATSDSYVELKELKRQVEILTQRKTIGELSVSGDTTATEIAELKQEIGLLKARQQLEQAEEAEQLV
jgi:hypothetical protein